MKRTTAIIISTIVTALLVVTVLAVSAAKSDTGTAQAASQPSTTATDTNVDFATQPQVDQSFTWEDDHEQAEHEHEGGEHSERGGFGDFGDD